MTVICLKILQTLQRRANPRFYVRFYPAQTTAQRIFIGMWNIFSAPTTTADMLNGRAGVGLWLDTGVSNNWKVMHNDGTGASTTVDTGQAITIADLQTVEIRADHIAGKFGVTHAATGTYTNRIVSTDIPTTQALGFLISLETLRQPPLSRLIFTILNGR